MILQSLLIQQSVQKQIWNKLIPAGARLQDVQIAYRVAAGIAAGVSADATIMSQSIREDDGAMFASFGAKKAKDGAALLQIMKTKERLVSSTTTSS